MVGKGQARAASPHPGGLLPGDGFCGCFLLLGGRRHERRQRQPRSSNGCCQRGWRRLGRHRCSGSGGCGSGGGGGCGSGWLSLPGVSRCLGLLLLGCWWRLRWRSRPARFQQLLKLRHFSLQRRLPLHARCKLGCKLGLFLASSQSEPPPLCGLNESVSLAVRNILELLLLLLLLRRRRRRPPLWRWRCRLLLWSARLQRHGWTLAAALPAPLFVLGFLSLPVLLARLRGVDRIPLADRGLEPCKDGMVGLCWVDGSNLSHQRIG